MKTVVITNQKGGVGKTTLSVHLAHYVAESVPRVLVIDLDSQGHTSYSLSEFDSGAKASDLFSDKPFKLASEGRNITLVAADPGLDVVAKEPTSIIGHLVKNMERIAAEFDFCVIDTGPAKGNLQNGALVVAGYVVSPVDLEQYSILGLEKLLATIMGIQKHYNPKLTFLGMLPSKFNSHSPAQKQALMELAKAYGKFMLRGSAIVLRTSIGEAAAEKKPVWKMTKTSAREAGKEFRAVLAAIEEKMGGFND